MRTTLNLSGALARKVATSTSGPLPTFTPTMSGSLDDKDALHDAIDGLV